MKQNEILKSYLRIVDVFEIDKTNLNNILLFISIILEQSDKDLYPKEEYLRRLNINDKTLNEYITFLVNGGIVKSKDLSKHKYIAETLKGDIIEIEQALYYNFQKVCNKKSHTEKVDIFREHGFKTVYSNRKIEITKEVLEHENFLRDLLNSISYVKSLQD